MRSQQFGWSGKTACSTGLDSRVRSISSEAVYLCVLGAAGVSQVSFDWCSSVARHVLGLGWRTENRRTVVSTRLEKLLAVKTF